MPPSKLPPSEVLKEYQRVIHFIAHNEVFQMEDLNGEMKKNRMFMPVHGNKATADAEKDDDWLSLNSLFLNGKYHFSHAFDREMILISNENTITNEILVLREELHRQNKTTRLIVGEHLTERLVSSSTLKGTTLVEGRTIKNNYELAKKNAVKCIAIAKIWLKGKNKLPSG